MKKLMSFIALLLMSAATWAQTRHIVIQVNGTLVQGVRARDVSSFRSHEIVSVKHNGRERHFAVYGGMSDLIFALFSNNNNIIHFADEDLTLIPLLLEKIKLKHQYKMSIISKDQLSQMIQIKNRTLVDLKKITTSGDVYLLTSRDVDLELLPEAQLLKTGHESYFYETYEQAEQARGTLSGEDLKYVPRNEEEWKTSFYKSQIFASYLLPNLHNPKLREALVLEKKKENNFHMERGENLRKYEFLEKRVEITEAGKNILGCRVYNNYRNKSENDIRLDECSSLININFNYNKDKSGTINSCNVSTGNQKIENVQLDSCLKFKNYKAVFSYNKKTCMAFNLGSKIKNIPLPECKTSEVYIYDREHNTYHFGEYSTDFARMSENEVLEILSSVPTPEEPFKLWAESDVDEKVGFAWRDCINPYENNHPIAEFNGTIREECEGDTFYSWGNQVKIDNLKNWMGKGDWVDKFRPLFMSRTPISSFGYGNLSIRVKMRDDVNWSRTHESHGHCDKINGEEAKKSVFYRTMNFFGGKLLDITVCSPHPIASWSYGTKKHYDEIIKDYRWTILGKRTEDHTEMYINSPSLISSRSVDSYDFSIKTLEKYILDHLKLASSSGGELFVNPMMRSFHTDDDHFSTDFPIYFNER